MASIFLSGERELGPQLLEDRGAVASDIGIVPGIAGLTGCGIGGKSDNRILKSRPIRLLGPGVEERLSSYFGRGERGVEVHMICSSMTVCVILSANLSALMSSAAFLNIAAFAAGVVNCQVSKAFAAVSMAFLLLWEVGNN